MILTNDPAKQRVALTFLEWLLQPPTSGRFLNMEPCLFLPEARSIWAVGVEKLGIVPRTRR